MALCSLPGQPHGPPLVSRTCSWHVLHVFDLFRQGMGITLQRVHPARATPLPHARCQYPCIQLRWALTHTCRSRWGQPSTQFIAQSVHVPRGSTENMLHVTELR